jgi:hypothetical protein
LKWLSLVDVGGFQPIDGDRVLLVPELEDKMFRRPFKHLKRTVVRVLEWGLLGVTPDKNKLSILEGSRDIWLAGGFTTMSGSGSRFERSYSVSLSLEFLRGRIRLAVRKEIPRNCKRAAVD